MLPIDVERFNQAVSLAQEGHKEEARVIIVQLLRTYQNDANLLLWFAFTTPSLTQARLALGKARVIDPGNPILDEAENWLLEQTAYRQMTGPLSPTVAQDYGATPQPAAFRPNLAPPKNEIDETDFLLQPPETVIKPERSGQTGRLTQSLQSLKFWLNNKSAPAKQ
jgi:hypothetical protein